jgi:hypothetical protein
MLLFSASMLLKILTFSLSCYFFETKFSLDLKDLLLFSGVFDTFATFLKFFLLLFSKSDLRALIYFKRP